MAAHRARAPFPSEMLSRDRWVRRSEGKVPLQVDGEYNASSTKPRTWSSYQAAVNSQRGVGLGYVLHGDGIVCLDLDHCLDGGELAPWARRILDLCPPTYVEVSPSGTGLHILGRGRVGVGLMIRRDDGTAVEAYDRGRYIAMTGKRWRGAPLHLADLSGVLAELG